MLAPRSRTALVVVAAVAGLASAFTGALVHAPAMGGLAPPVSTTTTHHALAVSSSPYASSSAWPITTNRRPFAGRQTLFMANNPGALKRIKTNERNRVLNAAWRSRVRTWTRKTTEAIEAGDVEAAKECARVATSMIDRATRRKIYHKNWAARHKSRLSKKVIKLILEQRGEVFVKNYRPEGQDEDDDAADAAFVEKTSSAAEEDFSDEDRMIDVPLK